ncbi:U3 small nucleolar RNA-associated protein 14 homolog A [Momordica charantia]|uniref:U3 small nucleolar RNA-associated protein 14 homolog A n=1 Tax=Momordica charantia TaxID=3673 RepID=A0A6J1D5W3_MOMCH|nr:U3 small nucleolar RNA-associated protein 14 homolog A [Momordica charantia]
MGGKIQKRRQDKKKMRDEKKHSKVSEKENKSSNERRLNRRGPRLAPSLQREIDRMNGTNGFDSYEGGDSDAGETFTGDFYEYEEVIPEEESKKNRRYDAVDNYEYELPDHFKDENIFSDDEEEGAYGRDGKGNLNDDSDDADPKNDDSGSHARMLQSITGMPREAFEGKKKNNVVVSEAYQESEYNPSRDVLDGNGRISIEDLLDPLQGKPGYSMLRKRTYQTEKKSMALQAPLPKSDRERVERKVAYEQSKKEVSKWEPIVKKNREAPTLYLGEEADLGYSTVGAIASEFEPRTEIEKKIASLVHDGKIIEAHRKDGSKLLELNKISFEDEKDRQNRIAKMRSLLFRHELKAKHIKKIKSKTYHRLLKKDRVKGASAQIEMDPDAAKELAMKQEFKRAEERMTLKHKNSSRWAKRILSRGLDAQDEGTRAAIADQLHQHATLTRKMNTLNDSSSSSDESSDEDYSDEQSMDENYSGASKLLERAKEKTLKALEDGDEAPESGLLALPFMVRGMKKREEAAAEEAKLALQEFESLSKQLNNSAETENINTGTTSGRRTFGAMKKPAPEPRNKMKSENYYGDTDGEDDNEAREEVDAGDHKSSSPVVDVNIGSDIIYEDSKRHQHSVFKSFDETVRDPGPKTTYEVSIFASDTWKKVKNPEKKPNTTTAATKSKPALQRQVPKETVQDVDDQSESDHELMVEGALSSANNESYELPSQAELIHEAFAGDNVEEEFERQKEEILNEENPEPEKPVLLPGWGQWTHVQKKKGLPSWMLEEHDRANKKRQEALKNRKDANLKHVIISEKLDKKAEKLYTKTLPFPYKEKDVFEHSIRMPIGPDFNPASAIGALNRPEVVKKSGVIIKPIEYEEVDPHRKVEEQKQGGQKQKRKNGKSNSGKTAKKMKKAGA